MTSRVSCFYCHTTSEESGKKAAVRGRSKQSYRDTGSSPSLYATKLVLSLYRAENNVRTIVNILLQSTGLGGHHLQLISGYL